MRRIELTVRPEQTFAVPDSDGYQVYGALLAAVQKASPDVSEHLHDSDLGSLHNSGLLGRFADSDRSHHKRVLADERYEIVLGTVDPADEAIFEALVQALVLDGEPLELAEGQLHVEAFESRNADHGQLLQEAAAMDDPEIEVRFRTPTCIEEAGEVTTMFPHRGVVFRSILGKWQRSRPEDAPELALDVSREAFERSLIEKPVDRSFQTHSVLVNRVDREDQSPQPIFRQGFTIDCTYAFKDATEAVMNATTALALFAEFSGVGSAVTRGCGNVAVKM